MKKISLLLFAITTLFVSCNLLSAPIKTINFATEATYPPFEFTNASGKIKGFDIDIANALCQQLKATCTFTNQPFASLIPNLKLGKFDAIIAALNVTSDRKQQVDFTDIYYEPTVSFVAPIAEHLTLTAESLKGKVIGTQGGTTFEDYLYTTYGHNISVKTYASEEEAFLDLTAGRIDAVVGDTPIAHAWLQQNDATKYALVGKPVKNTKFFGLGDGIAVRKGNADLLNALNQALAQIKTNGVYNKIYQTYFGNP